MPTGSSKVAVIGGSGLYSLHADGHAAASPALLVSTPYSKDPLNVYLEQTPAGPVWFLPRHGREHSVAPHEINYRANIHALQLLGAEKIIAVNAVGGISANMAPGVLVLPDQLIDYTWGRDHTFFSGPHAFDKHIDFTFPYDAKLTQLLEQAALSCGFVLQKNAVYACTQGPRLETAAEIRRLARDGCDVVGMTGMPEAALARELGLDYACLALVINRAAGLDNQPVSLDDMLEVMQQGMLGVRQVLLQVLSLLLSAS